MKKFVIALLMIGVSISAFAAEQEKEFYSKSEILLDSSYVARFSGNFDEPSQGVKFGVGYALTKNLIASVYGVSYNDDANLVNEVAGRFTARAPLNIISKKLAPYAFIEGGGNIQSGVGFGGAGGGIEWRPIWKQLGLYVESDLRLDTEWRTSIGVSAGINIRLL